MNTQERIINIINNEAVFNDCKCGVSIDYILINNINFNVNNIKNINIIIGNAQIIKIPFKLIIKLGNIHINDNNIKIKFPFQSFFTKYLLIFFENSFKVKLECNEIMNDYVKIGLIMMPFTNDQIDTYTYNSFYINTKIIHLAEPDYAINNNIHLNGRSYGLFFDLEEKCTRLELILNGITVFDFDEDILDLYSIQIDSLKCFYLPFNFSNSFNFDLTNSIDFDRIDVIRIKINNAYHIPGKIYNAARCILLNNFGHYESYTSNIISPNNALEVFDSTYKFYPGFNTNYYQNFNTNYYQNNKFINKINKKIKEGNNYCNIKFDEILEGEEYLECLNCHYNYCANVLINWFKTSAKNKCPLCQLDWKNNDIFVNI